MDPSWRGSLGNRDLTRVFGHAFDLGPCLISLAVGCPNIGQRIKLLPYGVANAPHEQGLFDSTREEFAETVLDQLEVSLSADDFAPLPLQFTYRSGHRRSRVGDDLIERLPAEEHGRVCGDVVPLAVTKGIAVQKPDQTANQFAGVSFDCVHLTILNGGS